MADPKSNGRGLPAPGVPRQLISAAPSPRKEGPSPDDLKRSQDQAPSYNGALLDAIRAGSERTSSLLDQLLREFKGFRKEATAHIKSLDSQVRYHQLKLSRYAKAEEEYYRTAMKWYLDQKGVGSKFPASSTIYKTQTTDAKSPDSEAAAKERATFLETLAKTYKDFKSGMKVAAAYSDTPIKLLDNLVAGAFSIPLAVMKSLGESHKSKKTETETIRKAEEDRALKAVEDDIRKEEAEASKEEEQDRFFERLEQVLGDSASASSELVLPTAIRLDSLIIDVLTIGSVILGQMALASPMEGNENREDIPYAEAYPYDPYAVPLGLAGQPGGMLALPSPPEDNGGVTYEILESVRDMEEAHREAADEPTVRPISGLLTGPEGIGSGPFRPSGVGPEESADSLDDLLYSHFMNLEQFFNVPASSEVGAFLKTLFDGISPTAGPVIGKVELDLPAWLLPILMILAVGVIVVLAAIAAGILIIAAAVLLIAAALAVGILAVLLSIAAAVLIVALVLGFLGLVIGVVLYKVMMMVVDKVGELLDVIIEFIRDPGAWIEKLLDGISSGIAKAMENIFGTLIDLIAKAFNDIPILKTISDFVDGISKSVLTMVADVGKVVTSLTGLAVAIIDGIKGPLALISGLVSALIGIVGGVVLVTLASILSTTAGTIAWFMAGGLGAQILNGMNKNWGVGGLEKADEAYNNAYGRTSGSVISIVTAATGRSESKEVRAMGGAWAESINNQTSVVTGKRAIDSNGNEINTAAAAQGYTQNNTTFVQNSPSFASIPLYGDNF